MRRLLLFVAVILFFSAARAQAQGSCTGCDPNGSCDISCWYCTELVDPEWGVCPEYAYFETTCGDYLNACIPSNCTPNWQESQRVNVGTYGETTYGVYCTFWPPQCWPRFGCEHHRVDRVTLHDQNECNLSSAYWDDVVCDDYVDFEIPADQTSIPNCCSFLYGMSCNDWHSCF